MGKRRKKSLESESLSLIERDPLTCHVDIVKAHLATSFKV